MADADPEPEPDRSPTGDHEPETTRADGTALDVLPAPHIRTRAGDADADADADAEHAHKHEHEHERPAGISTFTTDELTAHCPFSFGGPDFYRLTVRYEPDEVIAESKSVKRYFESYRDRRLTVEALADEIYAEFEAALSPVGLYVRLDQQRRGGIEQTVEVGDPVLSSVPRRPSLGP